MKKSLLKSPGSSEQRFHLTELVMKAQPWTIIYFSMRPWSREQRRSRLLIQENSGVRKVALSYSLFGNLSYGHQLSRHDPSRKALISSNHSDCTPTIIAIPMSKISNISVEPHVLCQPLGHMGHTFSSHLFPQLFYLFFVFVNHSETMVLFSIWKYWYCSSL